MAAVTAGLQIALALVFIIAAAGKTFDRERFVGTLRLSGIPAAAARRLSVMIPLAEGALVAGLLFTHGQLLGSVFVCCVLVLIAFSAWLVGMLKQNLHVPCGCFGRTNNPISWWTVGRNIVLIGVGILGVAFATAYDSSMPEISLEFLIAATSVAVVATLVVYARETASFLVLREGRTVSGVDELSGGLAR